MPSYIAKLLATMPDVGPRAVVMRHARRHDISAPGDYWTCGLTADGMEHARSLGTELAARSDQFRIFHSPVRRCRETAEALASGIVRSGGRVGSVAPEDRLGVSYIRTGIVRGFREADRHGGDFIRAWFDGLVDPEIFMPLKEALDGQLAHIREKLSDTGGEKRLDIHITHDWNINVLREGVFGLRHEEAGWPDFLYGLAFTSDAGGGGFTAWMLDGQGATLSRVPGP